MAAPLVEVGSVLPDDDIEHAVEIVVAVEGDTQDAALVPGGLDENIRLKPTAELFLYAADSRIAARCWRRWRFAGCIWITS